MLTLLINNYFTCFNISSRCISCACSAILCANISTNHVPVEAFRRDLYPGIVE